MRQMLAIVGSLVLCGAAWADQPTGRAALSYDENVVINTACAPKLKQSVGAFQECATHQMAALKEHPTPDRSNISSAHNQAIEHACGYHKRDGIGPYNDCVRKAMAGPVPIVADKGEKEFTPDYAKFFKSDSTETPEVTPVAATSLPPPPSMLPNRPSHIEQKDLSPAQLYKKVAKSVYVVLASESSIDARAGRFSQGSAVAVSEHLLLTNCHVVNDRPLIKIVHEGIVHDAVLAAADIQNDRCVIKAKDATLTPISGVRSVESLTVGERVFAVGAPRSLESTLSEGLISGLRQGQGRNLVQTSAPISPGSSGGGLFDAHGNLVGITTLGSIFGAQNLNFAIAASDWWQ